MADQVAKGLKSTTTSFHDDIYGQLIIEETPELLSSSFLKLDKALEKIPDAEKTTWTTALEKCPELCGESFKIMFLRCAHFDCDRAAERVVAYWDKRLELFTPSKAFLPMILGADGAMKDDEKSLTAGLFRLVPKADDAGHPIFFGDPTNMPVERDHPSMVRCFWYHIHAALDSEDGQKNGVVLMSYPKNASFWQFDKKLMRAIVESIQGYLPVRMSAIHIVQPPTFFRIVYPIMKLLLGQKLKKRINVHVGKQEKVLEKLEEAYRMPKQNLPTEIGGEVVLKQDEWLQGRKDAGL